MNFIHPAYILSLTCLRLLLIETTKSEDYILYNTSPDEVPTLYNVKVEDISTENCDEMIVILENHNMLSVSKGNVFSMRREPRNYRVMSTYGHVFYEVKSVTSLSNFENKFHCVKQKKISHFLKDLEYFLHIYERGKTVPSCCYIVRMTQKFLFKMNSAWKDVTIGTTQRVSKQPLDGNFHGPTAVQRLLTPTNAEKGLDGKFSFEFEKTPIVYELDDLFGLRRVFEETEGRLITKTSGETTVYAAEFITSEPFEGNNLFRIIYPYRDESKIVEICRKTSQANLEKKFINVLVFTEVAEAKLKRIYDSRVTKRIFYLNQYGKDGDLVCSIGFDCRKCKKRQADQFECLIDEAKNPLTTDSNYTISSTLIEGFAKIGAPAEFDSLSGKFVGAEKHLVSEINRSKKLLSTQPGIPGITKLVHTGTQLQPSSLGLQSQS